LALAFFAVTDIRHIHKFSKLSPFRLKFSRLGLSPGASMAFFQAEKQRKLKEIVGFTPKIKVS